MVTVDTIVNFQDNELFAAQLPQTKALCCLPVGSHPPFAAILSEFTH
jgi:hypothetical protein